MLDQTYELYELHSAVLEKELSREKISASLAHLSYPQQLQLVAMVLTPWFVHRIEQTPGYAAYFSMLVQEWREQRARQTP